MTVPSERFDVVIVGARVAGSSLGALLARRGLRVAVLDQAGSLGFTLSSNILQADSLAFLDRLGVTGRLRDAGVTPMTRVDMRLEDFRVHARFPQRPGDMGGAACIRREVLDPIVRDAAIAAGATVRLDTRVTELVREHGRVTGVRVVREGAESVLHARLVVGADGRNSTVAALAGARPYHLTTNERRYHWTYFEGADLGDTPTFVFHRWGDRHMLGGPADGGLYIVGVSPQAHETESFRTDLEGSIAAHIAACEPIATALADAKRATRIYGIQRFQGYFREASGPGWVLIGDAGHFKDPAGGRGIGDAFHQAERLAPSVEAALTGPVAALDRATAEFGRWRNRTYAEYYGLAADLGVAGPIAAAVPEVVRRLHARGRIGDVLDLLSHRATLLEVLTPARVLGATGRLLMRGGRSLADGPGPGSGRGALLREAGALAATEVRRRKAMWRPVYGPAPAVRRDHRTEPHPSGRTEQELNR
ncbi:NAD(P)/FAD-dependent oxidoreductase [Streptomyces sp. NA02950]|uniref:NAD(P)/FAD-dependent oxidoreductase n=1 Tax=Streptomyces sp. NA02950 TaxID=2742137 RepID=UPI0015912A32|nr:NAD(P)/FAD-dependent oxidoreductase [Streptomyces sp. NA02950]QKV96343.1 NAD(P)/FAD-dependent oxidoreductase [Streptomyces sp. NA02950]